MIAHIAPTALFALAGLMGLVIIACSILNEEDA